jgi:sulfatase maturation enzyme AslB (radical SAM superfamily)
MFKFFLYFSSACNWNCRYCGCGRREVKSYDNINFISETFDFLVENFEPSNLSFCIIGGEPGVLNYEVLHLISQKLKDYEMCIGTNGTFFRNKDLFYQFVDAFGSNLSFEWHYVSELGDDLVIPNVDLSGIKVTKQIVVGKYNLNLLGNFLDAHPNENFFLLPLITKVEADRLTQTDLEFIKNNYGERIVNANKIVSNENASDEYCRSHRNYVRLDFVNGKIFPCNKFTDDVPANKIVDITESNILALKNYELQIAPNDFCAKCPKKSVVR